MHDDQTAVRQRRQGCARLSAPNVVLTLPEFHMKIPHYPSLDLETFTPYRRRWMLTMLAEGIAYGLRLQEAGLVPPSVDSAWMEPIGNRWFALIAEASGAEVAPDLDDADDTGLELSDTFLTGEVEAPATESDPEYEESLAKDAWYWSLLDAAVEGGFHLAVLRDAKAVESDGLIGLSACTWDWFDALEPTDWELAPGLDTAPRLDQLTAEWLGNAAFELARRTGVMALASRPVALQVAQRAVDYVVCDRLVHGQDVYRPEDPVSAEEFTC